ncbi:MAG: toprim domain-containing protein, partial [Brevinematia bacterium]
MFKEKGMKNKMKNLEKQLIIVESPTKATLIQKLLGNSYSYKVLSCYGHVRDLPEGRFGIDLKSFEPEYVILQKAKKILGYLKENVKAAKTIYLATDPDREGEAIAWHLKEILKLKNNYKRIVFHEISERAIKEALNNPNSINMNLVLAQKARRVLDRII